MADDAIEDNRRSDGKIEFTDEVTADEVTFRSSFKGNAFGGLVDFYPFSNKWVRGFRVSGGYYFGKLDFGVDASVKHITSEIPDDFEWEEVNIDGRNYTPIIDGLDAGANVTITDITAKPKIAVHSTGPYLGFGGDIKLFSKLKLTLDAGMAFTKAHEFSMTDNIDDLRFTMSSRTLTINIDGDARIPADVKPQLSQEIRSGLTDNNVPFTVAGNNIIVDTARLLENNRGEIDSALDEIRTKRNKAINDVNKELKNYGYFPMFKIGFSWQF